MNETALPAKWPLRDEIMAKVSAFKTGASVGAISDAILKVLERRGMLAKSEDERELLAKRLWKEATATGQGTCPPSWSGHWMDWYRMRADEILAQRRAAHLQDVPANNRDAAMTPPILGGDHGEEPSSIPAQRTSLPAEAGTSGEILQASGRSCADCGVTFLYGMNTVTVESGFVCRKCWSARNVESR